MNRGRSKQRNKNQKQVKIKITRCSLLKRPVFEHEVCPQYSAKPNAESNLQENCKNCEKSF